MQCFAKKEIRFSITQRLSVTWILCCSILSLAISSCANVAPADDEFNIINPSDTDTNSVTGDESDSSDDSRPNDTSGNTPMTVPSNLRGVDIILVVDDSGSMAQEQEMLSTAVFSLINTLLYPLESDQTAVVDDIRIGITTSNMGVSYSGTPYTGVFAPHMVCSEGTGLGDNGAFQLDYLHTEINIQENVIPCDASAGQCPTGWTCDNIDMNGVGRCADPNGDGSAQVCPASPADFGLPFIDISSMETNTIAFTTACLTNVGTEGCAFEHQLAAGAAGMRNNPGFVRADSLTVIIVISDEEDCSLASNEWHTVEELSTNERNIACGVHKDLLTDVAEIKNQLTDAKVAAGGAPNAVLFAAITGVPPIPQCQGNSTNIAACLDIPLEHGTMGDPTIIERPDPNGNMAFYYEYACERFDNDGMTLITQAYPATRYVELAQLFGPMGYMYSICNADWSPAMEDISKMILAIVN